MTKINKNTKLMYKDFCKEFGLDSQDELIQRDNFTRLGLLIGTFGSSFKCIADALTGGNYNPHELYMGPIAVSGLFNLAHRGYSSIKPFYEKLKNKSNIETRFDGEI